MIWSLDVDDFTNLCGCGKYPLTTALSQGLRGERNLRMDCTWDTRTLDKHASNSRMTIHWRCVPLSRMTINLGSTVSASISTVRQEFTNVMSQEEQYNLEKKEENSVYLDSCIALQLPTMWLYRIKQDSIIALSDSPYSPSHGIVVHISVTSDSD